MKLEYLLTAASVELNIDAISSSIAVSVVESVAKKIFKINSQIGNFIKVFSEITMPSWHTYA